MQQIKRILGSKILLFFLLLAVIWLGIVSVKAFYKKYQLEQEISSLKKEIQKLDRSDQELSQLIGFFNDQNFLEKEAKDKLNLKSPEESVVMVPEAAITQELSLGAGSGKSKEISSPTNPEVNNFIKWWRYLFER